MIAKYLYQSILWKGLLQLSVFVLNIAIARHFEASVSGNIFYLVNVYSFLLLIVSMSLESGIIYFGIKNEISTNKLFTFSLAYTIIFSVIAAVLLLTFSSASFTIEENNFFKISLLCFIAGNLLASFCSSLFSAKKDFVWPNVVALFINILLIICIPFSAFKVADFITDENYFKFFFVSFVFLGFFTAIIFVVKYVSKDAVSLPSITDVKKLFKYSMLAWGANIVFFLLYRIDYFFVERYCTAYELGNYIQVSKIGQLFFLLPTIFASVIFPMTAGGDKKEMFKWLAIMSRVFLFGYTIICTCLIITGRWLFPFVFGQSFQKMHAAFCWLVPGILALSVLYTITAYNGGANKIKTNIIGSLVALLVIIVGNIVAIPWYTINAAALVSSVGYMALLLFLMNNFKKENKISLREFFIFKRSDIKAISVFITGSK